MELLQLKYFRMVARMEHLSNAARELSVAQPALSMMIARLEEQLGVPLFDRLGRNIRLNAYGKAFLRKVEEALTALEEGQRELEEMAGREKGCITISTSSIFRFNDLLKQFLRHSPEVKFRILQHATAEESVQLLEQQKVDFCFSSSPLERPGIASVDLFSETFVLGVPATHHLACREAIHLHEVCRESFISFKKGNIVREGFENLCQQAGFTPDVTCEIDEPAAIPVLVSSGLGVALVPEHAKSLDMGTSIVFLKIEEPFCQRTMQLCWHEKRYLSGAARVFQDFVINYFTNVSSEGV